MNIGLPKKNILGVGVTDASKEDILKYITKSLEEKVEPYYIVTPNPEMIVLSRKNSHFQKTLNQSRIALPDGVGLTIAAAFLGKKLRERISGTDFMELLCKEAATPLRQGFEGRRNPITVGFLGGRNGVAEKTAECLAARYPGLIVSFIGEEWGEGGFDRARRYLVASSKYHVENKDIQNTSYKIQATHISVLFVAFGFPKQEEWMAEHVGKIPVRIMMGVGGAFDYISKVVPRAPLVLRQLGFEWLYRLVRQPSRWRRQLALLVFLGMVFRERLRSFLLVDRS